MMTPENLNVLSADKPLTNPNDDRLGYATFAKHIAESICKMTPPEGLVIAIHGPWGSGKTTLLNFVVHYLQQKPQNEQPVIVHFNPWWFPGHERLIGRFFDQLQAVLSKWKMMGKQLINQIADFAEAVSEIPLPYAPGGKAMAKLFAKQKDVAELKDSIVNTLKRQKRRILVIIDDIERLTADEIRQLFRVIKAVADFPNVIYLLAFDREVAIKAVEQMQGLPGEAYLEKIVQVPFELPLPDKASLRRLLFERLVEILVDTPNDLFDQTYWGNVYWDGIDHFITTPRDIVRLANTLRITYSAVKGEVNPVDFIALETLRVFCPMLYDILRKNPEAVVGHTFDVTSFDRSVVEDLKSFHNLWLDQVQKEHREPVKCMLMHIFPKLEAVWGNKRYGADWESKWRKQLRACSPDIFPIYFRLTIPDGGISNAEMNAFLTLAGDAEAFGAKLLELANQKRPDGTTRVRAFLERLEDYTEKDIPSEHIPSVLQALFDVGDQLLQPEDEPSTMFDFGNDIRIGRIIWRLLLRLDEPKRFDVLRKAISNGRAVATIVMEVATFGQQHGRYGSKQPSPEEEKLITPEQLGELEKSAVEKVRDAAQQGILLRVPNLPHILYRWRDWAGEKEVKQWVQKVISEDKQLIILLEKFLQKSFSQSLSDRVGRIRYRLDPQWLEPFLEPSQIVYRVRRLAEYDGFTENQRTAMRVFLQEYELRQQGKDPNTPLARKVE